MKSWHAQNSHSPRATWQLAGVVIVLVWVVLHTGCLAEGVVQPIAAALPGLAPDDQLLARFHALIPTLPQAERHDLAAALQTLISNDQSTMVMNLTILFLKHPNRAIKNVGLLMVTKLLHLQRSWRDLLALSDLVGGRYSRDLQHVRFFAQAPAQTIHFTRDRDALPLVIRANSLGINVNVNGVELAFIIDTGTAMSVVSRSVADACRIPYQPGRSSVARNASGGTIDFAPGIIADLRLGSVQVQHLPVMVVASEALLFRNMRSVFGEPLSQQVSGVLGWDILRQLVLEIDLAGKQVVLARPVQDLLRPRNLFWLDMPIVRLRSAGSADLWLGIDSGSGPSYLIGAAATEVPHERTATNRGIVRGIGTTMRRRYTSLYDCRLQFGGTALRFAEMIVDRDMSWTDMVQLDGIFGISLFAQGRVVIDGENGLCDIFPVH
jgi:predicted aspartyl protease